MSGLYVRYLAIASVALSLAGCGKDGSVGPSSPSTAPAAISDAANNGGLSGFYFLPPIVRAPSVSGTFDGGLAPEVQICRYDAGACQGGVMATYTTTTGPGSETVRADLTSEHYIVNWHTNLFPIVDGGTYRISVRLGAVVLGYADVQVFPTAKEARNAQSNEFVGLVDGRTLPIKFRIEQGIAVSIEVQPDPATVIVNKTVGFTATIRDAHGNVLTNQPVTWSSASSTIATVDVNGVATGVSVGNTLITASSNGLTGLSSLTVIRPPVVSVEVTPPAATVIKTKTVQLTAVVKDGDGNVLTDRVVTWTSSDNGIATVDANGLVTGVSLGDVTITATCEGISSSAAITVIRPPVASVVVTPDPASVIPGGTVQITATIRDADGNILTDRVVIWSSANGSIATVDGMGLVMGVQEGSVSITATSEGISGTALVIVQRPPVASVVVSPDPASVITGGTVPLTATVRDAHGNVLTGRVVTWSSGDGSIATVNGFGLVTGVHEGTVNVTATSEGVSGSSSVTVLPSGFLLASVSAGRQHTCGLTTDGDAYCWGRNGIGQLGTGDFIGSTRPRLVSGGVKFVQISVFSQTTCAITSSGVAYCWGDNQFAQVGDGTFGGVHNVPAPVQTSLRFIQIATATNPCGIALDGAAWCWGVGGEAYGPTGGTPKAVVGGHRFTTLASGGQHVCGLDLAGASWCWGNGATEALGGHGPQPVQTAGGHVFARIVAGQEFTCALDTTGQAWCWGTNDFGVLGNGTTNGTFGSALNNSPSPTLAAVGLTFVSLSAGSNHACGLTSAGAAYCWGWNRYGQIGDGTTNTDRFLPVPVAGSISFASLGANGGEASCAVTPLGAVYCWGIGEYGHLGNGTLLDKNVPTRVVPPTP